jgi:GNAT superfamily N-acetyltransferase
MGWRVTRCMVPGVIWARYEKAMKPGEMQQVFGDHWPPAEARTLEQVYVWRDEDASPRPFDPEDHPAAWLSLTFDQFDLTSAHMSRGVWPEHHGNGLGKLMRAFAEEWCRRNGVDTLNISVDTANTEHLRNVLADPYWRHDALTWDAAGGISYGFSHSFE